LRFAIVGPLLAAPPPPGALRQALVALAAKTWQHPLSGAPVQFSVPTLERWYYRARHAALDPVGALRTQRRSDAGHCRQVSAPLRQALSAQYQAHPSWSVPLHHDNLAVLVAQQPALGPLPSSATLRRYLHAQGLRKQRRLPQRATAGMRAAQQRLAEREVRSFEAEYVHALWHADFHHGSRAVVTAEGRWVKPVLLGVLDDCSRLACQGPWYLDEGVESFVHGLSQALQKRAPPRALMTDNGAAMVAEELRQGLQRLGIVHEPTLPYSPYQNAKQEVFWASVEGRLMAMLEGVEELTLALLNEATQAWAQLDYQRRVHSELDCTPLARALQGPEVGRPSPGSEALRRTFRQDVTRTQRRSDGTISVAGRRFERPARYRHMQRVSVRYARWELRSMELVDPHTQTPLCVLYPLGCNPPSAPPAGGLAPLLQQLLAEYAATGLPPAYLPTDAEADR
jgi:transposase InsO family protein